jgi:hypothetical protein
VTLTVTGTAQFSVPARVLVDVTSSPSVADELTVYRVHADGSRYPLLTAARSVIVGSWSGYDYHAPFNEAFTYVAAAAGLESDPSAPVWVVSDDMWLVHPSDPDLSFMVEKIIAPQQSVKTTDRADDLLPLRRKLPVTRTSGPRSGKSSSMVIKVAKDDRDLTYALLDDGVPVLMNGPWGSADYGWSWVRISDVDESNPGGFIGHPCRYFTCSYSETTQPDILVTPEWTYTEMLAAFPADTYTQQAVVYDTYRDMSLDIRTP